METDENGRTLWMSHEEAPFPMSRGRLLSAETDADPDAATMHLSASTSQGLFPRTTVFSQFYRFLSLKTIFLVIF